MTFGGNYSFWLQHLKETTAFRYSIWRKLQLSGTAFGGNYSFQLQHLEETKAFEVFEGKNVCNFDIWVIKSNLFS